MYLYYKRVRFKKKSALDCLDKYKCDMMKKGCGKYRELGEQERGRGMFRDECWKSEEHLY